MKARSFFNCCYRQIYSNLGSRNVISLEEGGLPRDLFFRVFPFDYVCTIYMVSSLMIRNSFFKSNLSNNYINYTRHAFILLYFNFPILIQAYTLDDERRRKDRRRFQRNQVTNFPRNTIHPLLHSSISSHTINSRSNSMLWNKSFSN